jgi:hypothetical protein
VADVDATLRHSRTQQSQHIRASLVLLLLLLV